ncbi:MAG: hypothetical protein QNI99_02550 [Woeseiaceae bacterium]|nr:hypothetical protein [Woeseiaceae bacterium]
MIRIRTLAILVAVALLSGCISVKSYVDPAFGKATYDDIQQVSERHDLRIEVEFQRNGEVFERAHSEVENHVVRSLRATGVVEPVAEGSGSLRVVVNNVANIGESAAKGFGTGLTFGLAGSAVTDYYEISIEYTDGNGTVTTHDYKHALHTTVGNKAAPVEDVEPTTLADGFGTIVEEIILNFVKDMQDNGLLTNLKQPVPAVAVLSS